MKIAVTCVATILILVALIGAGVGIHVAIDNRDALPVLVEAAPEARQTAMALVTAVSNGDYEAAGTMILGNPDLGVDREPKDDASVLIWDAYQQSLTFTPVGDMFATKDGVAMKFQVSRMDMNGVTDNLRQYLQEILDERASDIKNFDIIYDENNQYREEFVMDALYDATQMAIENHGTVVTEEFTMHLVYRSGKWYAVKDEGLMKAISASLAG